MKKLVLFIAVLLFSSLAYSQKNQDVIYLKNGTILKGLITEQVPNEQLKIKTIEGIFYTCKTSDIEKITKEANEVNLEEYGGKFSYGIALGGGGIFGIPIRYYSSPTFALEIGAYYRPMFNLDSETTNGGIMISGGTNIFLNRSFDYSRGKLKLDGISLKAGYSFANYPESIFAVGWAHESFKKENKKRSFIFELGMGISKLNTNADFFYANGKKTQPIIYWKCNWNWYSK